MQGGRTSDAEHYGRNYPDKVVKGLAITQVVVAGLSVVSQVKSRCPLLLLLLSMNVNLEVLKVGGIVGGSIVTCDFRSS